MSNWKNVNNWHWVNKNCLPWSQTYFSEQLGAIKVENNGLEVVIKTVDTEGDVELCQRKGKLITIFDVRIQLAWKGTSSDGTEASGKIVIPEVAHDTDEDEYVFDISVENETTAKQGFRDVIKKNLIPILRKKLTVFSSDLIKNHSSDVYIENGKNAIQPGVTKERSNVTHINKSTTSTTSSTTVSNAPTKKVNTTSITDDVEFQTSAHEIYETLLDTQRLQAWTRGPVKMSREVGSTFELFNGNVSGKIMELIPDKKIVQSWRLSSWPAGHYSTVTFDFDQGSDSTKINVNQTGVPLGEEETTRNNWNGYYWRAIKQTFGFGAVF
ncbi:activator of Hsp90 ATPase [Halteromyces radiatus]|uniref:activator of Hsp90 ATPase n=1 Tax=Halteromyces radiatus TaxID=101107 RepID=UPI00221EAA00|nr:activator of Hsp90 ATPase [Halteromyces radiatus]KAI8085204.1 activator of Hsp90 ATPase [Halteromyces radiatus]